MALAGRGLPQVVREVIQDKGTWRKYLGEGEPIISRTRGRALG